MKLAGIISEYNPFHNGHLHLCNEIRKAGMTHIVSVMSGSFVQRGEPALFDKWTRTKAALSCGVDLILELPIQYSMSSAGRFAMGAVEILRALPIDTLCFGSEAGSIDILTSTFEALRESENHCLMSEALKKGVSYPRALSETMGQLFGENIADIASSPNNLLALEYLKASSKLNTAHDFFTIPRKEAEHDSQATGETIASASFLRKLFTEYEPFGALELLRSYVPRQAYDIYYEACISKRAPLLPERLEIAMLSKLRQMKPNDFINLPDVSEGLENRLFEAAKKALSIEEFCDYVKTKRYTHSRIRRIAYSALLELTADMQNTEPAAVRILGMNSRGKELLSILRKLHTLPISPDFADLYKKYPHYFEAEKTATDISMLSAPHPLIGGMDFTENAVIYK